MPQTKLMERRVYDFGKLDLPVVCPAGERITETPLGPACRCRIEDSVITAARDGTMLATFCMGSHEVCPTWRVTRELEWENRDVQDVLNDPGAERSFTMETLLELEERRESGDHEGAERIVRGIRERREAQGLRDVDWGV